MLRTTFSRIRKVCSIASIPRILRGDPSSAVSSAVVRKAFKSTNSTEDGGRVVSTEKSNDILPPFMFSPTSHDGKDKNFEKKIADSAGLGGKTASENKQTILTSGLPLTHRDRCQRIIDQAFGKSSNTQSDGVLNEQYFSHTVVNLEDTRREIHESEKAKLKLQEQKIHTDETKNLLPYNRAQYSIFKMSRELNLDDNNQDGGISITHSASAKEPELTKNLENVKGTAEETPPVEETNLSQAKLDFDKCVGDTRCEKHDFKKSKLKLQEQEIHTDNTKSLLHCNRAQDSIFKMSRELNLNDDNHDGISITHSASAKEPDLTKNLENVKGNAEETPPVEEPNLSQAKEDFDKCVNNPESIEKKALRDDDAETIEVVKDERKHDLYQEATPNDQPHTPQGLNATIAKQQRQATVRYQRHIPWFPNATTARQPYLTHAIEDYEMSNNNPKSVDKKALCDNAETDILVTNERKRDLLDQEAKPNDQPRTPQVLNATTAKQDEELLTQKLETVEETPVVEAHKPKLEGFGTPRVLGNEGILNCKLIKNIQDNCPDEDLTNVLDEVSKRCLNCPLKQIDEVLINEMEKLGMTHKTAQEAPSTPMEEDMVQMDEQEIQSESPKLKEKEDERATDIRICDVKEQAQASEEIVKPEISLKPLSCKSEEYYNSTKKFACNYLAPTHGEVELDKQEEMRQTTANKLFVKVPYTNFGLPREKWNKEIKDLTFADKTIQKGSKNSTEKSQPKSEQDSENVSLSEELLTERSLEPSYVLTCNETCPISPGSTMSTCQNSDFVDTTETIYMKKNIYESVRPKPQPTVKCKKMSKVNPVVMELDTETIPKIKPTVKAEIRSRKPAATGGTLSLDEQVSLTELLRRVREKSRVAYSEVKIGRCGRKSPRCIPMAPRSPPNNPVPPPSFGLPMVKRMPPVCRPKRRAPSTKCSRATIFPEMPNELNEAEPCAVRSNVILTDEIIDRLQNLGKVLGRVLRQTKSNVETLARDYEPWTPMPSWNIPQPVEKKEWQPAMPCIKGCPNFPKARKSMNPDPPCHPNSCEGFPKRRSFSMLDCFTVSLGGMIVYDLGDF